MSKREHRLAEHAHLVPALLDAIWRNSGLSHRAELYRRLGGPMAITPSALKRNWMRWQSVSGKADGKGRLARSDSLLRLIDAAAKAGWFDRSDEAFAPLLDALSARRQEVEHEASALAVRQARQYRALVRSMVRERQGAAFDDLSWLTALADVLDEAFADELRERLLEGGDGRHATPALQDELLAGTVGRAVKRFRESTQRRVLAFEQEVYALQENVTREWRENQDLQHEVDEVRTKPFPSWRK